MHSNSIEPERSIDKFEDCDVCGFCGEGLSKGSRDDQPAIIQHMQSAHKIGECSSPPKKFFRVDHFRQHLKHSHGCTSGEWRAKLEEICKADEIPDIPLVIRNIAVNAKNARDSALKERGEMQVRITPQAIQRGDVSRNINDKPSIDDLSDAPCPRTWDTVIPKSFIDGFETLQVATERHFDPLVSEYIALYQQFSLLEVIRRTEQAIINLTQNLDRDFGDNDKVWKRYTNEIRAR